MADRLVGRATRTHFGGLGGLKGDQGFAPEFQDDHLYRELWGFASPESRQVGHFLTAVDMGGGGGFWVHFMVGHEQATDARLGLVAQAVSPASKDKVRFRAAITLDGLGQYEARDMALQGILDPARHGSLAHRRGNSMEDLRLSVRGYRLGQMVGGGQMATNKDLANWIALNVAGN
jgi:hypothetical protein